MSKPLKSKFSGPTVFVAELKESFFMAMNAVASHKLRSSLTLLGILVGVFSIIIVMTAMRAMYRQIELELDVLGGQTFGVQKLPGVSFNDIDDKYWQRKDITYAQARVLEKRATLARHVGVQIGFGARDLTSAYGKGPPDVNLLGANPDLLTVQNWTIREGRALLPADIEGAGDVCVLGASIAEVLFPFSSAVDQRIKLDGLAYTVVGVLAAKGAGAQGDQDHLIVFPITTVLNRYATWSHGTSIFVQARDAASFEDTVEQVRGILRVIRKVPPGVDDDFEIVSKDSLLAQLNSFTFAVRLGITLVSSIALLAAGIGIMNIMLVSVTERTREIGVRRAIGAKKRNIMTQFIMEAVVLCEVGGVIGVGLGILGGNIVAHYMELPKVIPVDWIVIGLAICSAVGIIFGSYPAYKAANLDPIESLRYE